MFCVSAVLASADARSPVGRHSPVETIDALPRMLRIDLVWPQAEVARLYEVQRSETREGPFLTLPNPLPSLPIFSDYLGEPGQTFFYRVRVAGPGDTDGSGEDRWSPVVSATSAPYDRDGFLTEVQEAGFRYFHHYAHPASHLPREGIKATNSWGPDTISAVSTGMYFFNMAVGVERAFIGRAEAVAHINRALRFLAEKTDRFHGAFAHWTHGGTGRVIPFSPTDDGADLVETAILAQGLIFAREYFNQAHPGESELRQLADRLWREIEWNRFIHDGAMAWHWSPRHGFSNLPIVGFNEAEIAYILAVGAPRHAIAPAIYWTGWVGKNAGYFNPRLVPGLAGPIPLQLGRDYGMPMFLIHYSYLGLDPKKIPTPAGISLFEEFERLTLANHDYSRLNADRFLGYDKFWGLTASLNPDGYAAHEPIHVENGTISPTAALGSMPYQPQLVMEMMETMYLEYGATLWGPFGFYDAFNFSRNWVADGYIGIDVGPIAPMIENHRTGKLWEVFMQAPEINAALDKIRADPRAFQ